MSYVCNCGSRSKFIFQALPYAVAIDCSLIIANAIAKKFDTTTPLKNFWKMSNTNWTNWVLATFLIHSISLHIVNTKNFLKDYEKKVDDMLAIERKKYARSNAEVYQNPLMPQPEDLVRQSPDSIREEIRCKVYGEKIFKDMLKKMEDSSSESFCIFLRMDLRLLIMKYNSN